ncbi:hypothetical protein DSECCO2_595260 [anaerobic digester metagenome]
MDLDISLEDLLDGDCLLWAGLDAPCAGAAVVLLDVDLAGQLAADDLAFEGDCILWAGLDTDRAAVAGGLFPLDIPFDLAGLGVRGLANDGDARTEFAADAADVALLGVDGERRLGLQCRLARLAGLVAALECGDVAVDGVPRADFLTDGASVAFFLVDYGDHVVGGESLLLKDREALLAVDLECHRVEGAHDDTDATVRTLLGVDVDRFSVVDGPAACRADGSEHDRLFRAGVDTDAAARTGLGVQDQVVDRLQEPLLHDDVLAFPRF